MMATNQELANAAKTAVLVEGLNTEVSTPTESRESDLVDVELLNISGYTDIDQKFIDTIQIFKDSDFSEYTTLKYKAPEPKKLSRSKKVVAIVERVKSELEIGQVFISKFLYGRLALYNGSYWQELKGNELRDYLFQATLSLGFDFIDSAHYNFKNELLKQFDDNCKIIIPRENGSLVNLKNGTLHITEDGKYELKPFNRKDNLNYQLQFEFNPDSKCPKFDAFLDEVLPERESQLALFEFFGSAFISSKKLKIEKALILYGTGSNGKSVIFDIFQELFGKSNFSSFSLESLTDASGYSRSQVEGKLINYSSEISGQIKTDIFKQLVSGEDVDARKPYNTPFMISPPKIIFNLNQFPVGLEKTHAFFRRLYPLNFCVTIPSEKQDRTLSYTIIKTELSGIFNHVLEGMLRLEKQKKLTDSPSSTQLLNDFRLESDPVASFINDSEIEKSDSEQISLSKLYSEFEQFCKKERYSMISIQTFSSRLVHLGFAKTKKNTGVHIFAKSKKNALTEEIRKKYPYPLSN